MQRLRFPEKKANAKRSLREIANPEIYSRDRLKEQSTEYLYLAHYSSLILLFVLQTEVRNVG
jgi:hypothetical protein